MPVLSRRPIKGDPLRRRLRFLANTLPAEQVRLLVEMSHALQRPVVTNIKTGTDIATDAFAKDFAYRLILFHSMQEGTLTKKTFEYVFCAASRAAGRTASLVKNPVYPGEDVHIDGHGFSLKTESGASIRQEKIHISKLMEARWIRECENGDDFYQYVQDRVIEHLQQYERILTLRSFESTDPDQIRYELVEIPRSVLLRMAVLTKDDFSSRTSNGSSNANVKHEDGELLFVLSLDGSVEKITIRNLNIKSCKIHAEWIIKI